MRILTSASLAALALTISLALLTPWKTRDASAEPKLSARVFEMRTYTTNPGKLSHLHARFRDHTNHLFVKHGMTLIGYWTPVDTADTLVYVLGYPDREAAKKSWKAFLDDPVWKRAFEESHKTAGGPIVTKVDSQFMNPTDYSPIR
jgi:hypothetical protein